MLATIHSPGLKQIVDVTVDTDGDQGSATATVAATDNHPFWETRQRTWLDAGALQPGMSLRGVDGTAVEVEKISRRTEQEEVYNLTVDDLSTYYVLAGEQSLLVHNCGNLEADEGLEGAHSLKKHVGKDETWLKKRAKNEGIPAMSLAADTAQETVDTILKAHAADIKKFVEGKDGKDLYIRLEFDQPVGKVASSDGRVSDVHVVELQLKRTKKSPKVHGGFVVWTMRSR